MTMRHRVLYLNEHWQEGDGGEIVLYLFPSEQPPAVAVTLWRHGALLVTADAAPRAAVAHATLLPHDVDLPVACAGRSSLCGVLSNAALTAEFATSSNPATSNTVGNAANSSSATSGMMIKKVLVSSFRRHLVKLFYANEWTRSLHEAHLPTDAFAKYMRTHEQELRVIEAATEQMVRNFRAKDTTQPSTLPETCAQLAQKIIEEQQDAARRRGDDG